MTIKPIFYSLFFVFFSFTFCAAQPWIENLNSDPESLNFYEIQASFNDYWKGKEIKRSSGWKQFKRWEYYWENRVDSLGNFPPAGFALSEFNKYLRNNDKGQRSSVANWQSMGPSTSSGGYAGLGRIASVAFHPTDNNKIYVGAAGGGMWTSTNGGTSWITTTDGIASLGVSGIIVDPSNPNTIYIATGDGDGGDNYSVGVLKSTDAGATFNTTGLNWSTSSGGLIRRMIVDPNDNNTLLVASNYGIYRTTNAGTTWTQEVSGNFYDIEPNFLASTNTFYATTGSSVYKSTNNGNTWSSIYSVSGANRISIATTPANTNYIYILCSKSSDYGFKGLYRSTNSGTSFSLMSSTPNILGWYSDGSDSGGQGFYDLVCAADPSNAETIYIGGINTWKSTNGGSTWTIKTHWSGASGVQTVHADKHVLEWQGNVLWEGNDGGIYSTSNGGTTWAHKTGNMVISQMYKLGVSQTNNTVITGLQDNGTKLYNSSNIWVDPIGGDGMECIIKRTDASVMYGSLYFGAIQRSTNSGGSWTDIQSNISGNPQGAWVTPFVLDPTTPSTIYAGYTSIYKSTNQGTTWTTIGSSLGSGTKSHLKVAPSNSNYIYTGNGTSLYRTTNGGSSWSQMTIPGSAVAMIEVHPTSPDIIWAVCQNYTSGAKVYKSINGGSTWTNISGTLPNIPANCIVYEEGSDDGLYIGMDVGVYFKDSNLGDWQLFNTGLPNVEITELEINYFNNQLYVSTYGRGLWKSDLYITDVTCGAPQSPSASNITYNSVTISWNSPTTAPDSYEWAVTTVSTPPTSGNSINGTSVIVSSLNSATNYYFHIRSSCNESDFSPWTTIGPIKTMPTCGNVSYDSGGQSSNYSDNESLVYTICPNSSLMAVKLDFTSFSTEEDYDALYIYDGPNIQSPLLPSGNAILLSNFPAGGYHGVNGPASTTSSHNSGCLTIQFLSDPYVNSTGWAANVSCVTQCKGGLVENVNEYGIGSLRKEIECAIDGGQINFATPIDNQTILLEDGEIIINKNLTILGYTGSDIGIRAQVNGPIFNVSVGKTLNLNNLKLYGGTNTNGRAIINNGILNLTDMLIFQNSSVSGIGSTILNQGNGTVNILTNTQLKIE